MPNIKPHSESKLWGFRYVIKKKLKKNLIEENACVAKLSITLLLSIIWKKIFFKETITISLKNEKLQICFSTKTILFIGRISRILKLPQFLTGCSSHLPEIPK